MTTRTRNAILALVLSVFFVSVVLADFRHTERGCQADPRCPACRFQSSSLSVATIVFFHLPGLGFLEFVEPVRAPEEIEIALVLRSPRGPPQA